MCKKPIFFLFLLFTVSISFGQFYKSILPPANFTNALEKIVLDFRLDYKTIQGRQLAKEPEMETYESTITLPGTTECKILRFHSVMDTTANWQAVVYNGDDYKEAVKAYQNMYRFIKKSQLHWIDRSNVSFTGELQPPKENVRFATTTLLLDLADSRYKNFQALVELRTTYNGWEVQLNLNKKNEVPGM